LTKRAPRPDDVDAAFVGFGSRFDDVADRLRRPKWMDIKAVERLPDGSERELPPRKWEPQDFVTQLGYVVDWLNSLLEAAHVRRGVVQPAGRHALAVVDGYSLSAPLFGVLVLELAAYCAKVNTLARCQNCGRGFKATRVSAAYCPRCRDPRIRWKLAQQRKREVYRSQGLSARGRKPIAVAS
jgi:hypothetical protein